MKFFSKDRFQRNNAASFEYEVCVCLFLWWTCFKGLSESNTAMCFTGRKPLSTSVCFSNSHLEKRKKPFVYSNKAVSYISAYAPLSHCQENWNSGFTTSHLSNSATSPSPTQKATLPFLGTSEVFVIGKQCGVLTATCKGILHSLCSWHAEADLPCVLVVFLYSKDYRS